MEADLTPPLEILERAVEAASLYGQIEYDDIVQTVSRDGEVLVVRTLDEDDEAGPEFQLTYFGSIGGRHLLELSRDGVAVLVEAHGPSVFALLYA